MSVKKHFALFFVYCFAIITGLSLFLIFQSYNKNASEHQSNKITNNKVYASKLVLNCPRTINLENNTSVELTNGFIEVQPKEKLKDLVVEVVCESSLEGGITFKDNVISAFKSGNYKIKFMIDQSSTKLLTEYLIVNVVEILETNIKQVKCSLTIGEPANINDIFNINSTILHYEIKTDNNISLENGSLIPKIVGESNIIFICTSDYICRKYTFKINVKEKPNFNIVLVDVGSNATIENNEIFYNCEIGSFVFIQYEILNNSDEYVAQSIFITTDNEIISYSITEPLIKIQCLQKGKVTITINCLEDLNANRSIIINFI